MGGSSARTEETDNIPRTEKEQKDAYNRVKKGETIKLG